MTIILKNGKIYIEKDRFEEAILIKDGIIEKIGSNEKILKENVDEIIDLEGKTILPGLNDSHLHLSLIGEAMANCNLNNARSIEDVIGIGKEFLKDNPDIKALKGTGWNQDYFTSGDIRHLNRHDLDQITTDIPIVFDRVCNHLSSSNTKAIEILNIDGNTQVSGGVIELDENNIPNGVFKESGVKLIQSAIPKKEDEQIEKEILNAMDYCIKNGITSVSSCDIMNNDSKQMFQIIRNIYKNKKTKLRYYHQYNLQDIDEFKEYLETEFKNEEYDGKFLSKGALKLFKDGSLGARTALLKQPYNDDKTTKGVIALEQDKLLELLKLAHKNNIQVLTHTIGDGAIKDLINAYKSVNDSNGNKLRHGIVHCQITDRELLDRISKDELSVIIQPIFLDYDIQIVEDRVGKELTSTSYAFNTLYKSNAKVSLSTDAPIEDVNPFDNLYSAVTRLRIDETPSGGFYPKEKMSIEDAIDGYTIGSAYNQFQEDFKGRIKEGYVADLIVLDRDIFTIDPIEIKDVKVEKTMIDGSFVYEI